MTNSIFRLLSIFLTIAVITLFPGVANAGQISLHNSTNQPMTCYAAGDSRNTVKQNTQRILLPQGETLALNPQDFSTQTIDRVECAGYNADNLNVTPNSPDRYLSFTGQAQDTLSVLLYPYLPTTPEANFQPMVQRIVNEFQQKNPQILLNAVITPDLAKIYIAVRHPGDRYQPSKLSTTSRESSKTNYIRNSHQ